MPLKILFFGIILVIVFYVSYFIWDSISSESYTLDNVNEIHKQHISAVNNKSREDLKTDLNLATLNRNVQLHVDDSTHYFVGQSTIRNWRDRIWRYQITPKQ